MTLNEYADKLAEAIKGVDQEAVGNLGRALFSRRRVYTVGNGGSAAIASHFVADIVKTMRYGVSKDEQKSAVCISDNIPLMTAYANDTHFETTYGDILYDFVEPDDLVILISSSGASKNIMSAFEMAKGMDAMVFSLTGFLPDNPLRTATDQLATSRSIWVDSKNYGIVEDAHSSILHWVIQHVREGYVTKQRIQRSSGT